MDRIFDVIYASKGLHQELLRPVCRKYDLTDSEIMILLFLSDGTDRNTATDIVIGRRIKKSVVSASLKDLQDRGLISGYYLEGNHRSLHLKVNESASEIISEAKKVREDCYGLLTEGLDRKEKNDLKAYLKIVNENITRYRK